MRSYIPQIVRSGVAEGWARSGSWEPVALAARFDGLDHIVAKRSTHTSKFMYAEQGQNHMLNDGDADLYEITKMSMRDFCERSGLDGGKEEGAHHYLTMPAIKMGGNLLEIAPGWRDFADDEGELNNIAGEIDRRMVMEPYLSVWMGGEGVITQAHYDVANNVFVQLHGKKRFRCWV